MALTLTQAVRTTAATLAGSQAWLTLLTLTWGGVVRYRWVNNQEDVVYAGSTYAKRALGFSPITESLAGDLPTVTLGVYDTDNTISPNMSTFLGYSGGTITLYRIYANVTTGVVTAVGVTQYFTILDVAYDGSQNLLNFALGASAPLSNRFPRDRYSPSVCRFRYGDGMCNYDGGNPGTYQGTNIATQAPRTLTVEGEDVTDVFYPGQYIRIGSSATEGDSVLITSVVYVGGDTVITLDSNFYTTTEPAGAERWITALCNQSLTACLSNFNSLQFGASPGMREGVYG